MVCTPIISLLYRLTQEDLEFEANMDKTLPQNINKEKSVSWMYIYLKKVTTYM